MDELKPSPRNELLWQIAQKLRSAPAELGRANPVLGRLSEVALGDIPKGLEHWAYGDRMFGPPANAPLVNDRTLSMLESAPIGAAGGVAKGAALAQLVPARPLFNADALAARKLHERVREAERLRYMGASDSDIWHDLKLTRAPGLVHPRMTGRTAPDLYHSTWLEEIDPANRLKRGVDFTQPGVMSADQVFDSPALFSQYPQLRDLEVELVQPGGTGKALGLFNPNKGPAGRLQAPIDAPDMQGTLAHEMSHGVMNVFNQGNSFGHGVGTSLTPEQASDMASLAEMMQYTAKPHDTFGRVPEQIMDYLRSPEGRNRQGTGAWNKSSGEAIAEAVRMRSNQPTQYLLERPPHEAYPTDISSLHNDQVVQRANSVAAADGPLDYKAEALVRLLRKFGVIPK